MPVGTLPLYECSNCYEFYYSTSYNSEYIADSTSVTAVVKNTGNRQKHTVELDIGCVESNSNATGCTASATALNLRVEVYMPTGLLF